MPRCDVKLSHGQMRILSEQCLAGGIFGGYAWKKTSKTTKPTQITNSSHTTSLHVNVKFSSLPISSWLSRCEDEWLSELPSMLSLRLQADGMDRGEM